MDKREKEKNSSPKFPLMYKNVKTKDAIRSVDGKLYEVDTINLYLKRIDNPMAYVNSLIDIEYRDRVPPSIIEMVVKKLKIDKSVEINKAILNPPDYVHVKNGVLHIPSMTLLEKDLNKYVFTYMVNANYLEDKEDLQSASKKNFGKFLKNSFGDNMAQRDLLLSLMGYLLTDYTQCRVGVFLIGPTACGKSVVCNLMQFLLGDRQISNISLNEMASKFNVALLKDKKLNISTELNGDKLPYSGMLKAIISNDKIYGDIKFQEGVFFKCSCKILQASNIMPSLRNDSDTEGAFRNRMAVVKFPKQVLDRDPYLFDKLKDEIDAIFTICINQFFFFIYETNFQISLPQDSIQIINESFSSDKEKILGFIKDDCVVEDGAKEYTYLLYQAFERYCKENMLGEACSQLKFINLMTEIGKEQGFIKSKFRKAKLAPRSGFKNIKMLENKVSNE